MLLGCQSDMPIAGVKWELVSALSCVGQLPKRIVVVVVASSLLGGDAVGGLYHCDMGSQPCTVRRTSCSAEARAISSNLTTGSLVCIVWLELGSVVEHGA